MGAHQHLANAVIAHGLLRGADVIEIAVRKTDAVDSRAAFVPQKRAEAGRQHVGHSRRAGIDQQHASVRRLNDRALPRPQRKERHPQRPPVEGPANAMRSGVQRRIRQPTTGRHRRHRLIGDRVEHSADSSAKAARPAPARRSKSRPPSRDQRRTDQQVVKNDQPDRRRGSPEGPPAAALPAIRCSSEDRSPARVP